MIPTDKSEPQLLPAPILASNIERDTATRRIQAAFAEHRLTDDEFDQRADELSSAVTTITAVSYKSRTEIVLPPGVRMELGGTGVSAAGEALSAGIGPDAPVVRVKGVAYKGSIEVRTGQAA